MRKRFGLFVAFALVGCTNETEMSDLEAASEDVVDVEQQSEALLSPIPFSLWLDGVGHNWMGFDGVIEVTMENRYRTDGSSGTAGVWIRNVSASQRWVLADFMFDCEGAPDKSVTLDWVLQPHSGLAAFLECRRFNWSAVDGSYR